MKCLVTGGSGFLGINLIRYFLERGISVRSLDVVPFTYPEAGRIEWIKGDIRDRSVVLNALAGTDLVVHCADRRRGAVDDYGIACGRQWRD